MLNGIANSYPGCAGLFEILRWVFLLILFAVVGVRCEALAMSAGLPTAFPSLRAQDYSPLLV